MLMAFARVNRPFVCRGPIMLSESTSVVHGRLLDPLSRSEMSAISRPFFFSVLDSRVLVPYVECWESLARLFSSGFLSPGTYSPVENWRLCYHHKLDLQSDGNHVSRGEGGAVDSEEGRMRCRGSQQGRYPKQKIYPFLYLSSPLSSPFRLFFALLLLLCL